MSNSNLLAILDEINRKSDLLAKATEAREIARKAVELADKECESAKSVLVWYKYVIDQYARDAKTAEFKLNLRTSYNQEIFFPQHLQSLKDLLESQGFVHSTLQCEKGETKYDMYLVVKRP
jgi:hypothetical protein